MKRKINYATVIFLLAAQGFGCTSDEVTGTHYANRPPEVWLAIGPPEGSVTDYRVHVYWGGWDPDGEISHFEWALTSNETGVFDPADTTGADKWHRTFAGDSIFKVSADALADSSQLVGRGATPEFRRAHTFFVRAVDDQGRSSTRPVYRSFTARTISPEVFVSTPQRTGLNPAFMPPLITFRWSARDDDADNFEPDSVRSIIVPVVAHNNDWGTALDYIRENADAPEWTRWVDYHAEGDSGRFWTTDPPLDFGQYLFAAQAKDEAGAVTPVFDLERNVRRVLVTDDIQGPTTEVRFKFMTPVVRIGTGGDPVIIDVPAGLPVGFSWSADPSSYGGTLHGYRYGWDILDLNDDEQWEITLTPFIGSRANSPSRVFFFGTHTFFLEVADNNGQITRVIVVVNIVPFTMGRSLLVVDDWEEFSLDFRVTNGLSPSDEQHDDFWLQMVDEVAGFSQGDLYQMEGPREELPINVLAQYDAVIWNAIGSANSVTGSRLTRYIGFVHPDPRLIPDDGSAVPNILNMFMEAGGKVLICGQNVMATTINRDYFAAPKFPLIYKSEVTGNQSGSGSTIGAEGFAYQDCCLNVVDVAYTPSPATVRRAPAACPVDRVRERNQRTDGLRECIPMDSSYAFPTLELRPEVAGLGRWYHESRLGLNTDIYNPPYFGDMCNHLAETIPPRSCFQPMYGHGCLNTSSAIYGAPIGFWTSQYANRIPRGSGVPARSAVWGFQPVYFNPSQVKEALNVILFDEWQLPRH